MLVLLSYYLYDKHGYKMSFSGRGAALHSWPILIFYNGERQSKTLCAVTKIIDKISLVREKNDTITKKNCYTALLSHGHYSSRKNSDTRDS